MVSSNWVTLSWVAFLAVTVRSVDTVYVTDIEIVTYLVRLICLFSLSWFVVLILTVYIQAPCASSAISYNVGLETYSTRCGDGQTALQSCICRNTNEFNHVVSGINTDISSGCGTEAGTSDLWSASKVMEKYCNPDRTITFSTPTNTVNAFVMELAAVSYLAPCAQSGLSYAVGAVCISLF